VGLPCSEGERTCSLTAPARGAEGDSLEWRIHHRRSRRAQNLGPGCVTSSFFESLDLLRLGIQRWEIQTVHLARHLFHEHCQATLAPMSHLRIAAGIHQPSREQSPGYRTSRTGPEGKPWSGLTIGISASFRVPFLAHDDIQRLHRNSSARRGRGECEPRVRSRLGGAQEGT
jgi:hypothetical protein